MTGAFVSVAIDGPAGAGKSTIARSAAQRLGFTYVDTGAMYRVVALYYLKNGNLNFDKIDIDISYDNGLQIVRLGGVDVTEEIRSVSALTSQLSAKPEVRSFLLEKQRAFAKSRNVIMDGRDIGTVVLPEASVKIFLTASLEKRARRRYDEMLAKGLQTEFESVLNEARQRDENDMNRAAAPLKMAHDAILVDTTDIDLEESIDLVLKVVKNGLGYDL